jgi:Caspase domain
MTLWLDRSGATSRGAPVTHALVVGVSRYAHLPPPGADPSQDPLKFGLVGATTPATGAVRFARWLRYGFRPAAPLVSIRLLLSPSDLELQDPEMAATAAQVEPATTANVRAALLEWQAACQEQPDGMAVVYLSGHGASQSRIDHSVLLEDFAADRLVMDHSVDVGRVHRGMAGPTLPQTQFYFVDACRIRPDAFSRYRAAGNGLGLPEEWYGEDQRAAPIYFSASPGTAALGEPGNGTLFSQALMHCLHGTAVHDFADSQGRFAITGSSLQLALEQHVASLADRHEERQEVVVGGQVRGSVLHYFERAPELPLAVQLHPESAGPVAWADLWDSDRAARVVEDGQFEVNPMVWRVPVGMYSLDVTIRPDTPPLQSKMGLPVAVAPGVLGPRRVTLA